MKKTTVSFLCSALLVTAPSSTLHAQADAAASSTPASEANQRADEAAQQAKANADRLQQQLRQQEHQLQAAQTRLAQAQGMGGMMGMGSSGSAVFSDRLRSIIRHGPSPTQSLVLPAAGTSARDVAALQEDLAVMAHLLNKSLEQHVGAQQDSPRVMGVDVFFGPNSGSVRNLYLDGYGALFLLNVGFPLMAPPPASSSEAKEAEPQNSAWQQAKEELYGQSTEERAPSEPAEEYSEQKVSKLKQALMETFKNAANIRQLKAEENVTVCVLSSAAPPDRKGRIAAGGRAAYGAYLLAQETRNTGGGSMLTIRAKKADIDDFAKGKTTLEAFGKQAQVTITGDLPGAGGVISFGGNSSRGFGGGFGGFGGGGSSSRPSSGTVR